MNKKYCLLFIKVILVVTVFGQHKNTTYMYDAGASPREHNLDFERMRLYRLDLPPAAGEM